MKRDNKRYLRAVIIVIIIAICNMKLPHNSKSIFQFIMPPIKTSPGSRLYLSGIITVLILLWSYNEIVKSNYFKHDKVTIFILMFFFIVPIITKGINVVKIPYYALSSGLRTIEVIDSNFGVEFDGKPNNKMKISLHLKNYSSEIKEFNISVDIPKSLSIFIAEDSVMLPKKYMIGPYKDDIYITEIIEFNYAVGYSAEDIFNTNYVYDNYKIKIYNENSELVIILNDSFN